MQYEAFSLRSEEEQILGKCNLKEFVAGISETDKARLQGESQCGE